MIVTTPKKMNCSLEKYEVETLEKCGKLLTTLAEKLDVCGYELFHTEWNEDISSGELYDIAHRLAEIIHISEMY